MGVDYKDTSMEIAIMGLITGLGYAISRQGIEPRKKIESVTVNRPESYPVPDAATSQDLQRQQEKLSEERWIAAQKPGESGIFDPRTMPFFKSMKTQHTNDDMKQRRMELHSGKLDDATWKHKKESGPRFEPTPQRVTSSGSSGNAPTYDVARKVAAVSGVQNNVLPFQQIRVGRGIGVDSDVPASDGFHPMYRVMPVDHASYKKNSLEGRANHGAAVNSARTVDPKYYSKGVPRFYTMERRPMEKGRATVTGQSYRPSVAAKGCHVDNQEYFGIAGAKGHNVSAGAATRNKSDANHALPQTNVTGARHGVGGYTYAEFDNSKIVSQQRENTKGHMNLSGDHKAQMAPQNIVTAPTNRAIATTTYTGTAGHFVPVGTTQPLDLPQPTIREQIHDQTNGYAPAAPIIHAARIQCTDKQLLKEAKRGSQVVNTYVSGPQRSNEFRRAKMGDDLLSSERCINMAVKVDGKFNRIVSHAQSGSLYMNQASPGESSTANRQRLPEVNRFQDYTLARDNLKGNELHIPIN